ncbi:LysM peptidoglycan-binding domain-containing protein [Aliivibrio kagoshimensis]|uniref:lytic transglycosylase n=1 Tax=Aliivibrio kagoshimensis TaxID=2910230 RepID=UPI003D0A4229
MLFKLKIYLAAVFLLAGCQLTQPKSDSPTTTEANQGVSQSESPASPSDDIKSSDRVNTSDNIEPIQMVSLPLVISPQQQADLWDRIAMQLELPVADHKLVDYYRDWYIKHPNHLRTVSKRATPFLYLITEKIEERGLPMELALLPVVESSFDPFAYSHGSAAGLWQFIPSTGKRFGLEQNWWYDGRRDVAEATDAALDLMVYLNKKFDGDWSHAVASYNSGEGRVFRSIKKNKQQGKPTDFFSLSLPKETSGYVPKLMALADVIKNHEQYGVDLPFIANEPYLEMVNPKEQLDLAIAANYADMSIKELQSYNPAYNQWATSPDGPYHLLLPIEKVTTFTTNAEKYKGNGVKVIRYKVKSGDTLSQLAVKNNTTTSIIRHTNGIDSNSIRVGKYILIPTSSKGNSQYALSAPQRLEKLQSKSKGKYKVSHSVKSGESLWTIARDNNISYQELAKWNGIAPKDSLRVGQKLVVWKNNKSGAIIRPVFYTVRSGDSLSVIASKFKVSVSDIMKWNNIKRSSLIRPGKKLKLYVDVTKVSV